MIQNDLTKFTTPKSSKFIKKAFKVLNNSFIFILEYSKNVILTV